MKLNKVTITTTSVILMGLAIRLLKIDQPLLEYFPERQTQTAEITRNIYVNGWADFWTPKVRYFTNGNPIPYVLEFPLYNGIVAVFYYFFGPNVIWGRIASLTFFVLSASTFYHLSIRTIPTIPAILSILFFVFSPLHILISRSFQPEELALFLLLLAIYKKSWFVLSLAILTKLPIVLFTPVLIYRQLNPQTSADNPVLRRNLSVIATKTFAALLPSLIWYSRASLLTTYPTIAQNFNLSNWFQPQLWLNPDWYFSLFQIEHIWVLTSLGLLFFMIGASNLDHRLIRHWKQWLVCGLLYVYLFNYHSMTHEYYHILLLPPLAIFVGLGLNQTINFLIRPSWKRTLTASGIILLFSLGLIAPAWRKITSAPPSPETSGEIGWDRYRYIEDFDKRYHLY